MNGGTAGGSRWELPADVTVAAFLRARCCDPALRVRRLLPQTNLFPGGDSGLDLAGRSNSQKGRAGL